MTTTTDRVQQLWQWCRSAYLRHGHQLSFPKNTDPAKTYQWRYLQILDRKLSEWQFDSDLCKQFIEVAVAYAKERHLIRKGLSIFCQGNIIEVCYARLMKRANGNQAVIQELEQTRDWLAAQAGANQPVKVLLARKGLGDFTNIVKWHKSGHISEIFLATSRACTTAMAQLTALNSIERSLLPSTERLYAIRLKFSKDQQLKSDARNVMNKDWRESCP